MRSRTIHSAFTIGPADFLAISRDPKHSLAPYGSIAQLSRDHAAMWVETGDSPQVKRIVVLEDVMARRGDAHVADDRPRFFGEVPIWIGPESLSDAVRPDRSLSAGYQREIGFMVEVSADLDLPKELTAEHIAALADGAKLIFAWARDDEGVIFGSLED